MAQLDNMLVARVSDPGSRLELIKLDTVAYVTRKQEPRPDLQGTYPLALSDFHIKKWSIFGEDQGFSG